MPYGPGTYGSKVGRPKKKSMLSDDRETYGAGAIVRKGIKAVKRSSEMKGLKKDIAKGLELDNTYNTKLKDLKSKESAMQLLSVIIEYFTHDEIKEYYANLNPIIESYLKSD